MPVNIGAELQALPLEYMLSAPLQSAIKGQALAAQTTVDFIEKVGLEEDPVTLQLKVRNVEFTYTKQVSNPADPAADPEIQENKLSVPMLAIVPVPYIRIEELTVGFEFKVKETITQTSKKESSGGGSSTINTETKLGGGFFSFLGGPSATIKANVTSTFNVTTSNKSSSTQDRSARITINMKATQDQMPAGLEKVLNILNDAIVSQPE